MITLLTNWTIFRSRISSNDIMQSTQLTIGDRIGNTLNTDRPLQIRGSFRGRGRATVRPDLRHSTRESNESVRRRAPGNRAI